MIKRTIEISQQPAHLAVRLDQLLIQPFDQPKENHASIPCEDIGMVLVDHPRCTCSFATLEKIVQFGGALIVCGRDHLPSGVLLPLSNHTEIQWRINDQLAISKPLKKQLWTQLVQAKILAQAGNLSDESKEHRKLIGMSKRVRSGDPTNLEAQAARVYWSAWKPQDAKFQRDANGNDPLNIMLNYGYSIMRAAVGRAIVAAGLLPMLGLHHCNRSNNFALADDLNEPLRPMVDQRVRELYLQGCQELDQTTKARLLELLGESVLTSSERGPLMVSIHRMVSSLVKCYAGDIRELEIPVMYSVNEGLFKDTEKSGGGDSGVG